MARNDTRRTLYGWPTSSSAQRTRVSRASPLPPSGGRSKAVMVMVMLRLHATNPIGGAAGMVSRQSRPRPSFETRASALLRMRTECVARWKVLLLRQREREFAVAHARGQALGELCHGVLAIGRHEPGERCEHAGLRQAVAVDAIMARF